MPLTQKENISMQPAPTLDLSLIRIPNFNVTLVERFEQISGGGNNRVFKLYLKGGELRILKNYFRHPNDLRDRLQAEYGAFSFLWKKGVRAIPEPFGADVENGFALYQYFEHDPSARERLGDDDIDQASEFAKTLFELANAADAKSLPPASEACFSLEELLGVIHKRLRNLQTVDGSLNPAQQALELYLHDTLVPAFVHAEKKARKARGDAGMPLALERRTLSSSDFGFHNALKKPDQRWVFQDFEYFGWDDPVKLIIDFELHPAMNLSAPLSTRWRKETLSIFAKDPDLVSRLEALYPLYVIKWCIILLNEFVPEYRARRTFASTTTEDLHAIQLRQLRKAQAMLGRHY